LGPVPRLHEVRDLAGDGGGDQGGAVFLHQVEAGEELLISQRGRMVARLCPAGVPCVAAKPARARLRAKARLGDVIRPVGGSWGAET
jgi:antitoxin (DNA-binding transcriptional repressor) of toxin-antitoxin stability system